MPVLVIVLTQNCNLFMFEWKVVFEKECILQGQQGKSRFTVAEG